MAEIYLEFVGNPLFRSFLFVCVCMRLFLKFDIASFLFFLHQIFCWTKVVLNTFEAQPLSDEEGDANNLEEEAVNFSIKYLTSSKLMGLEVSSLTILMLTTKNACSIFC